jgi:hypothetical protein
MSTAPLPPDDQPESSTEDRRVDNQAVSRPQPRRDERGRLMAGPETREAAIAAGKLGGRPKMTSWDLQELCRGESDTMVKVLKSIALRRGREAVKAASTILAYGHGLPRQSISFSGEEGKPPILLDSVSEQLDRIIAKGPSGVPVAEVATTALAAASAGGATPNEDDDE